MNLSNERKHLIVTVLMVFLLMIFYWYSLLTALANGIDDSVSQDANLAKGDIEYGEYLSQECVTCHQQSGEDSGIPSITGWDPAAFIAVMGSYKLKERDNKVMQTIASRLDEEQLASLAIYFESLGKADQ